MTDRIKALDHEKLLRLFATCVADWQYSKAHDRPHKLAEDGARKSATEILSRLGVNDPQPAQIANVLTRVGLL